jgi:uncharacterized membrane protein YsdA (DUF1294 family)
MDSKGKPCALEARIEGVEVKRRVKREGVGFEYGLVVIFAFVLGGAVWWRRLPEVMVHVYWVLSTVCFAMYALDKKAAQTGLWRIPEARLHFIALLGGWPGALVAQAMFRHKTRKRSFRFGFWLTVLANCGFVGWLMSSEGAAMRRAIDRGWRALLAWVGR